MLSTTFWNTARFQVLLGGMALVLAALLALAIRQTSWMVGFAPVLLAIGIPVFWMMLAEEKVGIYLMLAIAFTMNTVLKLIPNLPIGLLMDFCILVMALGMLYRCYWHNGWKETFHTPLTWVIVVWVGWHVLEFANPIAASRVAWFYVVRPVLGYILIFFFVWKAFSTLKEVKQLFFAIVLLTLFSATWGVWQSVFGYLPFEMLYIVMHDAVHLVFIQGRWRSFGTMGSPAHFGVVMAYMITACGMLLQLRWKGYQKFILLLAIPTALLALIFSGARSGYAVLPISLMVVVGLSQNIKLYALSAIAGIGLIFVIIMPSDNYHIQRIQSTFKSSEDESFQVRERNREMITPWIMAHPMGGGLGSTGVWGQRFSPGTFLANFPPDSGYVRVAVEMGWIGFLLYLLLWAVVLGKSLWKFIHLKDPECRVLAAAILAGIVPLIVVETAQDIIGKLPSNLLFWIWLAMLFRVMERGKLTSENPRVSTEKSN